MASFELANRPVKNPKSAEGSSKVNLNRHLEKVNQQKKLWMISFPCPHCNGPINASIVGGNP